MKNFIKITTLTIITTIISSSVLAQPAPNEQKPNLRPQPPIQAGNPNSQQAQPPKQPNNPQARPGTGENTRPQQQR